jgi:hypothetical protein
MRSDTVKAHAAYQDFPTRLRDVDPDISIFIGANTECAKLL